MYFIDSTATFICGALCILFAIIQFRNSCVNEQARKKVRQLHRVLWAALLIDGTIAVVLSIDIRGAFGILNHVFRGICVLVMTSVINMACVEWVVNLMCYTIDLGGSQFNLFSKFQFVVKLAANLGCFTAATLTAYFCLSENRIIYMTILMFYMDFIALTSVCFQIFAMASLYRFTKQKLEENRARRELLSNEHDQLEERFKIPICKFILTCWSVFFIFIALVACGAVLLRLEKVRNMKLNEMIDTDPDNYIFNVFLLLGFFGMVLGGLLGILLCWIPLSEKSEEGKDWISALTKFVLRLTWKLIGNKIFTGIDQENEKRIDVTAADIPRTDQSEATQFNLTFPKQTSVSSN
jgi:hypothetical protein